LRDAGAISVDPSTSIPIVQREHAQVDQRRSSSEHAFALIPFAIAARPSSLDRAALPHLSDMDFPAQYKFGQPMTGSATTREPR